MKESEQKAKLKKLLTPEFLATLTEVAKLGGWDVASDYGEVWVFLENLYSIAGVEVPDLNCVEIEYDE